MTLPKFTYCDPAEDIVFPVDAFKNADLKIFSLSAFGYPGTVLDNKKQYTFAASTPGTAYFPRVQSGAYFFDAKIKFQDASNHPIFSNNIASFSQMFGTNCVIDTETDGITLVINSTPPINVTRVNYLFNSCKFNQSVNLVMELPKPLFGDSICSGNISNVLSFRAVGCKSDISFKYFPDIQEAAFPNMLSVLGTPDTKATLTLNSTQYGWLTDEQKETLTSKN